MTCWSASLSVERSPLRPHPGCSGLICTCLQGSIVTMHDGRKQHFSGLRLKSCPQITASSLGRKPCILTQCTLQTCTKASAQLTALTQMRACISLSNGISLIFPSEAGEMLPKGTPGILQTEMRLQSNYFCHITFRTNRPSLQTCIRCKPVCKHCVCKHCFSHPTTPCQKVRLLFMIQCLKICWLPESLNLEPKFTDTSSTGTPHMREKPWSVTLVMLAQVIEA